MRPPTGMPTMSKRAKRVLISVAALIVLAVLWFQFVGIYVDWEWYGEVGFRGVFSTQLVTRIVLFLVAALGAGGAVLLSLLLAYRSRPVFVPSGEVDPLSPYRTIVTARPKWFALGIAIIVGIICGLSAQSDWTVVQLWLHGQSFGQTDPQFGHDVGFYVFALPFLQMLITWLFVVIALCFFAVLVTQYLFGGIRISGPGRRISSAAALQLSLLVGAFVLVKAVQYWFDRYELLFSDRSGLFTGASYTDVNAVLPAKIILMCIAAICAVGFVVGAFLRSVKLPAIALALLVLSSVLIGGVWPLILQQVVVNPNRISKEPVPYLQRNIAATSAAYGIDKVKYSDFIPNQEADPTQIASDAGTISNARLLDPNVVSPSFTQQQQLKNWYGFPDQLSVDRYKVDGQQQDYIVAARELNAAALTGDQTNWINEHVVYTHGNGFVAAPANQVTSNGLPNYSVSDLFQQGKIKVNEPRIYYGSMAPDYAIVGSESADEKREYDTDTQNYTYTGKGGVHLGNLFQRLVFATHYGEANFLFSSEINGNSKIIYNRDPRDRVQRAAPFLITDTKPYPAVVDGRIVWIVDAYTTVQNFPYSQKITLSNATNNSLTARGAAAQSDSQISYIRNSVKATVDAYDGTVKLYGVDETDPVLKAWQGVFPGLITPGDQASADLKAHFRYPQDLFEIQRSLLVKYNVTDPVAFSKSSGFWNIPDDPTVSQDALQPPYYLQIRMPGVQESHFELTSVLTAYERQFMNAYLAASSDPDNYGALTVLRVPTSPQTPGPAQIQALFRSTNEVSTAVLTATNQGGSQVTFGNLLTLPISNSDKSKPSNGLLYVEPFYIKSQSSSSLPQLNYVLVWYAGQVGVGTSLRAALTNAQPKEAPTTGEGGGTTTPSATGTSVTSSNSPGSAVPLPANQAQAVKAMEVARQNLEAAKKTGDLGKIGVATQQLEEAVDNYLTLAAQATAGSTPSSGQQTSAATSASGGG